MEPNLYASQGKPSWVFLFWVAHPQSRSIPIATFKNLWTYKSSKQYIIYNALQNVGSDCCLLLVVLWIYTKVVGRLRNGRQEKLTLKPWLHHLHLYFLQHDMTDHHRYQSLLSPLESYKTLGVFISRSGSAKRSVQELISHSIDYASHEVGSSFSREEAYFSYLMTFFPKVQFPLKVSVNYNYL